MAKKNRPGQGARKRAKEYKRAAAQASVAGEYFAPGILTRAQRIRAQNHKRRVTHKRLDEIEKSVRVTAATMNRLLDSVIREGRALKEDNKVWRFRVEATNKSFHDTLQDRIKNAADWNSELRDIVTRSIKHGEAKAEIVDAKLEGAQMDIDDLQEEDTALKRRVAAMEKMLEGKD